MPQAHDLLTLLIGMALGAVAAHFHPGTITRRKRQAEATAEATAKPKRRSHRLGIVPDEESQC